MDITIPALFMIDAKADAEEVQHYLSFTPVAGAVALSPEGLPLAQAIASQVRTDFQITQDEAILKYLAIAEQIGVPVALIGNFPQPVAAI